LGYSQEQRQGFPLFVWTEPDGTIVFSVWMPNRRKLVQVTVWQADLKIIEKAAREPYVIHELSPAAHLTKRLRELGRGIIPETWHDVPIQEPRDDGHDLGDLEDALRG
jgi:hypothetical protein